MGSARLTPIFALNQAITQLHAAAEAMLPLISATLRAQFPTGAYLVLTRPGYDGTGHWPLRLHSIRDAQRQAVYDFRTWTDHNTLLPPVPKQIVVLWGYADPRDARDIERLVQRVDEVKMNELIAFLPAELRTDAELEAESRGDRTPLGIPLAAGACALHGEQCPAGGHIKLRPDCTGGQS
ncbi:hypothetical protein [Streptomyces sp. NPDC047315]|uniref:hypothetical protein n=1 Tax=Streptomyces sp. NPDC047315 TaxID=3155142 RepID=UPI0033ED93DA